MFACLKSEFGALGFFVSNARPVTFYEGPMTIGLDMFDSAINSQAKALLVPLLRDGGRIVAMTYAPGGCFWQLPAVGNA